ncbi:hypothetical protein [Dyella lutea]|uniref:DUF4845 domain-containing protein n=1 Tax=Dyella lutea TaxID=2950441 RepID=A0ABT1FF46_9GAMM|nr:hypothetical protein [Dyella lutea]MCP1376004.1 hypothetical protein [Dyella lutea]
MTLASRPRARNEQKKRGSSLRLLLLLIAMAIGAWGFLDGWLPAMFSTKADLETSVVQLMQEKFDSTPQIASYHLYVNKVTLIHVEGNRYKGIATVIANGHPYDVPVDVTADGKQVMYQMDTSALMPLLLGN